MNISIRQEAAGIGMMHCPVWPFAVLGWPQTSLDIGSVVWVVVIPTLLFILYWNRKLQQRVGEHQQLLSERDQRLQFIFEHAPEAVLILDAQGNILLANDLACEAFRLGRASLLKRSIHDLMPAELKTEILSIVEQWFSGVQQQYEGTICAGDGHVIPVELTGRVFRLDNQPVLQLHLRDITFRKEAEDQLRAARELAEDSRNLALQAHRMSERVSLKKSEFLASMSREIRTPLNDIVGMAELVNCNELTLEQKNGITTIKESAAGLLNMVNRVLDIAKLEAGQMEVHCDVLDLWDLCKKLQTRFKAEADVRGIQLICRCQDTVPLYLNGDEKRLEQVLEILLDNAVRFTHEGSVELKIECHSKTPAGVGIYFRVIDSGTGITTEKQATLYTKRIQVVPAGNHNGGLGLAICKDLVELMGGVLGLDSTPGKGSEFHFSLSLPQATDAAAIKALENRRSRTVLCRNVRVLLVEDNQVNQRVGLVMLEKIGCLADAVDNGKYAVEKLRTNDYDLVLMDCDMPIMDGFETTEQIRSMGEPECSIPIVAITANAMMEDQQKCLAAGMNDYISKPVGREVLIKIINKFTAHHA